VGDVASSHSTTLYHQHDALHRQTIDDYEQRVRSCR
jgi:hypothetical protein